jgi:hypothetical protein
LIWWAYSLALVTAEMKTSIMAMAELMEFLLRMKNSVNQPCPKISSPGTLRLARSHQWLSFAFVPGIVVLPCGIKIAQWIKVATSGNVTAAV